MKVSIHGIDAFFDVVTGIRWFTLQRGPKFSYMRTIDARGCRMQEFKYGIQVKYWFKGVRG